MMVLDVTGSMNSTNAGDSVNKITALKTEVMNFYDTIMDSDTPDVRIRFGVVPYSSNVNVGRIINDANPDWISNQVDIPSRRVETETVATSGPVVTWNNISGFSSWSNTGTVATGRNSSNCSSTPLPSAEYETTTISSDPAATSSITTGGGGTDSNPDTRRITTSDQTLWNAFRYRYRWSNSSSQCRLERAPGIRRATETSTEDQRFRYIYSMTTYDVTDVRNGTADPLQVGRRGADVTPFWNGCLREPDTVAFASNVPSIPSGAIDLSTTTIPSSEAQRWRMHLPNVTFARSNNIGDTQSSTPAELSTYNHYNDYTVNGGQQCSTEAMNLTEIPTSNRGTFAAYINSLTPNGNTYHDVGMLWGGRLISPTGLFGAVNSSPPNGQEVSRHIVYMTDGEMYPNQGALTFQGVEWLEGRVGSANDWNELRARHNRRLLAACNAAKAQNITVWFVSFGTSLDATMRSCASGDRSYQADNAAELQQQFQNIAAQISRLRLSE
jgi:hypothetical protein